jgi:hypothetical protein
MRCRRGPDGEFIAEVPSMSELETKLNNILEEHQHESGLHMSAAANGWLIAWSNSSKRRHIRNRRKFSLAKTDFVVVLPPWKRKPAAQAAGF